MKNVCLATVSVHCHLACRGKWSVPSYESQCSCVQPTRSLNSGCVIETHTSHGKNCAIATEMYQPFHYSSTYIYLHVCYLCIRPLEHVCYKYLKSMIGAVQFCDLLTLTQTVCRKYQKYQAAVGGCSDCNVADRLVECRYKWAVWRLIMVLVGMYCFRHFDGIRCDYLYDWTSNQSKRIKM